MTNSLVGKVALVTGAARGIGRATAKAFLREGASVIAVDIDETALAQFEEEAAHSRLACIPADVSTLGGNKRAVTLAEDRFGALHIAHLNAAVTLMGRCESMPLNQYDQLHQLNLRGVYLGCRTVLPALRRAGGGSIILTASAVGLLGEPDMPAYSAMKGGLLALTRSLAVAYGSERIRVNCVAPGDIDTEMAQIWLDHQPDPQAARAFLSEQPPLQRMGTGSEVASAVLFLASDNAAYVTGAILPVDGGLTAKLY
jgi:meso-butanediol dehydrogenase/(S,S)-butanediol dehydrogenase/diacetyl reductase